MATATAQPTTEIARQVEIGLRMFPHTLAHMVSGGRFQIFRWILAISTMITMAIAKGNARILINMPPRHGKSEFFSYWVPVWFMETWPDRHVMIVSHGDELATDYGRTVRNEFAQNPNLHTHLREDSKSAGRWHTPQGGGMLCAGVGGSITGRGFHLGIVDDPIKDWQDAHSPLNRRRLVEWFQSTFYTRAEPGASMIVIMHRWHEDDLAGWLLQDHADDWLHIRLPAIAEEGDTIGRAPGEALCPERFDVPALDSIRLGTSDPVWNAMHQQRPDEGGIGRVYARFNQVIHIDPKVTLKPELPIHLSIDFNLNPGMHIEVGQHDPQADQFTVVHEIHGPRMDVQQAIKAACELLTPFKWPELHLFGDATGKAESVITSESAWQAVIRGLQTLVGVQVRRRVPKANPPVVDRVMAFNDVLHDGEGRSHYRVHPRCVRLIADMKDLRTDENGLIDKHERILSHASDAEGYRINYLRPLRAIKSDRPAGRFSVS